MTHAVSCAASFALLSACGAPPPTPPTPPSPTASPVKSIQLNAPGEVVDVEAALPPGYVAVVDFWGAHCGACEVVGAQLAIQVASDDRIVIRKVDVGDGFSAVARRYDIGALPHYRVYDRARRLRYVLVGHDCLNAPALAAALAAER